MISIHLSKVAAIQKKFEADIIKHRLNAIKNLEKIIPDSTDDCAYLYKVKELFKNNDDILIWTPKKLQEIKKKFIPVPLIENQKKNLVNGPICEKIIKALNYKKLRQDFYPEYFNGIGIKACVYCNSQLAVTVTKDKHQKKYSAKFDVDHYFSKDKHPYLSISLFNLYPVCATCNRIKSKNDYIEFELYTDNPSKINKSSYKFTLNKSSKSLYLTTKDSRDIQFLFEEPLYSKDKKKFDEVFHIKGIYQTQNDIAEELIIKSQIYNKSYLRLLRKNFNKLSLNPELFKRMIIGYYTDDKDIHKRPMNKFTRDIAEDLGLIDFI